MYSYQQWCDILRGERLPAVVVDLDAFDHNIDKMAKIVQVNSKTLRLATKSVRVPALLKRVLARDHIVFKGLMCFSAEEAGWLGSQGFDDFLIAYPTLQRSDLRALRELHEAGKRVTLMVDGVKGIEALVEAMNGVSRPFRVALDIDGSLRVLGGALHIGVRRSPLRTMAQISALIDELRKHPDLTLVGAMVYEAQIAGLGDRNPFKKLMNPIFCLVRSLSVRAVIRQRKSIAALFKEKGARLEIFNGGGTGSLNFATQEKALTELSAGSGLLCSHLFDYYSNISFEPSCFFALQAVRSPDPGYVTCLGGGYIASGEPGWDKVPKPYLPAGVRLVNEEGCGEVQTPVRLSEADQVVLGAPILFRHAKAGELAERFDEYLLVSQGKIVERARTYRGLQRCFF